MEKLFALLKDTDGFNRFYYKVMAYPSLYFNKKIRNSKYFESDEKMAMFDTADVEVKDSYTVIRISDYIGKIDFLNGMQGIFSGKAELLLYVSRMENDLKIDGFSKIEFDTFDNSLFNKNGACRKIDDLVYDEQFTDLLINMADILDAPSRK